MTDISLIVSIVRKGWGNTVLDASINAGAHGGTVLFGRGTGIHERQKILGIPIEPEKEVILTVAKSSQTDAIMEEIIKAAELRKPGSGTVFVVPVEKVFGAVHMKSLDDIP
jgi:nitrogen regulatory protein PII